MNHEKEILFIQGKSMAFGTMEEYQEEDGNFCIKTTITEGTLKAGNEIQMQILVPYQLDEHYVGDFNSRN